MKFELGGVFIHVANGRAQVARDIKPGQHWAVEIAANWADLETQAIQEVSDQGGSVYLSARYEISDDLTASAQWDEGE